MNSDFLVGKLLERANATGALKMNAFVVGDFCTDLWKKLKGKKYPCRYYKPRKHDMFEKNMVGFLTVDKTKPHLNMKYLAWSNSSNGQVQ